MSPITDRSQAKESGFAQVREAMTKFEGDVVKAEFDQWGGKLIDEETGKPIPPREFFEISCENVEVLEVTEELAMEVNEWNFRVNCSDFKGSFWIERFLESADKFKILIPDGLVGKRVTFAKVTLEAVDGKGVRKPKYDSTNFIIEAIKDAPKAAPNIKPKVAPQATQAAEPEEEVPVEETAAAPEGDPMEAAMNLAVGKTEAQFRSAIGLHQDFINSPLLPLAKAGLITQSLVKDGKLVEVQEGNKTIYQLPE